jgi:hypothetical protein
MTNTIGLVQSELELIDGWRNLQALLQHRALSLQSDVLGPADKTRQITLWLNVLTLSSKHFRIIHLKFVIIRSLPIEKFFVRFSNKVLLTGFFTSAFFMPAGRAATFFFVPFFAY